jgi:ABC-type nitrate/sulfonate/bicarbonate transport system substrate-binding protein
MILSPIKYTNCNPAEAGKNISNWVNKTIISLTFLPVILSACGERPDQQEKTKEPVQIAYNNALILEQIGLVLERTDILKRYNLSPYKIKPIAPQTTLKESESSDIILTSVSAQVTLNSEQIKSQVVAVTGYGGRIGLLTRSDSPVQSVRELQGKKIAYPIHSVTGRLLNDWLSESGLARPDIINIPFGSNDEEPETRMLLAGEIDAVVLWDPFMEVMIQDKKVRILKEAPYYQGVLMSKEFIREHPQQAADFLSALRDAIWFWINNRNEVNGWYAEKENVPLDIVNKTSGINQNYKNARSRDEIILTPDQPAYIEALAKDAQYQYDNGFTRRLINPKDVIDFELIKKSR